jgi:hypothetical protein
MKNRKYITVLPSGYGHWSVESTYRGKRVKNITSDSQLIDRYKELKDNRDRGIISVEKILHKIAKGL